MKKKTLIALIVAGALSLTGGSVYAAGQLARSNAIGKETAQNFAFVDAGILPEDASVTHTEFSFDKGSFVYEIGFTADGIAYDYVVDAANGKILEKETENLPGYIPAPAAQTNAASSAAQTPDGGAVRDVIGVDRAKAIALDHAGLSLDQVVFSKARLERDDGLAIYDLEFYVAGVAEYEYEIDAVSGKILEESFEQWEAEDSRKADAAAAQTQRPADREAAAQETNTQAQPETQRRQSESASQQSGATLSVDEAKRIALKNAGLSADQVVFSKARLERDDGKLIYDIEFYVSGKAEYEYEIDAKTGKILESDMDPWENDDWDDDHDDDWDDDHDD